MIKIFVFNALLNLFYLIFLFDRRGVLELIKILRLVNSWGRINFWNMKLWRAWIDLKRLVYLFKSLRKFIVLTEHLKRLSQILSLYLCLFSVSFRRIAYITKFYFQFVLWRIRVLRKLVIFPRISALFFLCLFSFNELFCIIYTSHNIIVSILLFLFY